MATLFQGILGGFSGTVGTVIGSGNRKGKDIIRAKSKKPRTNSTEGQINQQSKFGLVTAFLRKLNFLLKIGFKGIAGDEMSSYNYACKVALNEAITGASPDFELDYSKVKLSSGQLSMPTGMAAVLGNEKVTFHWDDNAANSKGATTDKAVMVVYNATNTELTYSLGEFTRVSKTGDLSLPYTEVGDRLLFYLFFQSATVPTDVTTSKLVGEAVILE